MPVTRRSPVAMRMARSIRWRTCAGRGSLLDERSGHVLEHARQIDFLLIMAAERGARLLAGDRQHRHVIQPRVIEAGDQVRGAGARSCDADAEFAGELGVGRSHERGHFLMPRLDELDLAVGALQRAEHTVDAVAGIAEDSPHAPGWSRSTRKSPTVWDIAGTSAERRARSSDQ